MPKNKENKGQKHTDESKEDIVFEDEYSFENKNEYLSKLKKVKKELLEVKKREKEYLTGWQKSKADYANDKMRQEKELVERKNRLVSEIVVDLLPTLDSFDMAMSDKKVWEKTDENWRKGVESIRNQLWSVLSNYGLEEINEDGVNFDPLIHDPGEIIKVKDKKEDEKVLKILQKGYRLGGLIVRPARVRIGNFKK